METFFDAIGARAEGVGCACKVLPKGKIVNNVHYTDKGPKAAEQAPHGESRRPAQVKSLHFDIDEGWSHRDERVTGELPITILVNDREFATMVCSPWDVEDVVVGFLASEGVLANRSSLLRLDVNLEDGVALVEVEDAGNLPAEGAYPKRRINSSTGRGRMSFYFETDARPPSPVTSDVRITPEWALDLMEGVMQGSRVFARTGGVHAGILATDSEVLQFHDDVGRNNVLDRIFGRCIMEGIDLSDKVIAFSGRVSSEIVLKVAKMGVPILVSHAAPTELGLQNARQLGITVIAFTRHGRRFNLYTYPERIIGAVEAQAEEPSAD